MKMLILIFSDSESGFIIWPWLIDVSVIKTASLWLAHDVNLQCFPKLFTSTDYLSFCCVVISNLFIKIKIVTKSFKLGAEHWWTAIFSQKILNINIDFACQFHNINLLFSSNFYVVLGLVSLSCCNVNIVDRSVHEQGFINKLDIFNSA